MAHVIPNSNEEIDEAIDRALNPDYIIVTTSDSYATVDAYVVNHENVVFSDGNGGIYLYAGSFNGNYYFARVAQGSDDTNDANYEVAYIDTDGNWSVGNGMALAPLYSPTFTGNPKAPTPAASDNSTKIATTGWTQTKLAKISQSVNEDMTVGTAEQLLSTIYATDKTPYIYRQTGGGVSVGNREKDTVIGASLGWNQLSPDSNVKTLTNWTVTSGDIVGTSAYTIAGHVYAVINVVTKYETSASIGYRFYIDGTNVGTQLGASPSKIIKSAAGGNPIYRVNFASSAVGNVITEMDFEPQAIDLTLALGSTVADYVYTQESGTAGAGVALLKKWGIIDGKYKAYDAGSIQSVSVTAHKTTGVNLWNEQGELGGLIWTTGVETPSNDRIRTDYIPVYEGITYYVRQGDATQVGIVYYDLGKNYVYGTSTTYTQTTAPTGAAYARLVFIGITSYTSGICFNVFNPAINGQYFPYEEHTYPLNAHGDLRGVLKLDGSNNLYSDGDVYSADGTVTVKYGIVDLGSLSWTWSTNWFQGTVSGIKYVSSNTQVGNAIASNYTLRVASGMSSAVAGELAIDTANIKVATGSNQVPPTGYLVYELATPTTRPADPYQEIQICANGGTEEYTQAGSVPVPVGHDTDYYKDIVKAIEGIPEAPSANGTYTLVCTVTGGVASYSWA